MNFKLKKAGTYGFYDVFIGQGWKNHTRVRWNKQKQQLQFIDGKHLPVAIVVEVQKQIQGEAK